MNKNLDSQLLETQALKLINHQSFSLASIKLQRTLKHNPSKKAQIYDWLGAISSAKDEPPNKAHQKFKRSLSLNDPNHPDIYLSFAAFLFQQNKFEEALTEINKFIQAKSSDPRGLHLMAKIYFTIGLYTEAEKAYSSLLAKHPRYRGINSEWATIATVNYYLGNFEKAKKDVLKAFEINPTNTEAYRMLGYLLISEQKYKEAEDYFQRSIEIEGSFSWTWLNWSVALMMQKKDKEAMEKFQKGVDLLDNGNMFNKREDVLQVLYQDMEFKQRYIKSGNEEQRKIAFRENIEGLKKIISLLEKT